MGRITCGLSAGKCCRGLACPGAVWVPVSLRPAGGPPPAWSAPAVGSALGPFLDVLRRHGFADADPPGFPSGRRAVWGWTGTLFPAGRCQSDSLSDDSFEWAAAVHPVGNIFMFLPFGFFPALLWRGSTWKRAWRRGLVSPVLLSAGSCWWDGPLTSTICGSTPWGPCAASGAGACWSGQPPAWTRRFRVRQNKIRK